MAVTKLFKCKRARENQRRVAVVACLNYTFLGYVRCAVRTTREYYLQNDPYALTENKL